MKKSGMGKHLNACPQRKAAIETANRKSGQTQKIYHLQVQDVWGGEY
jgi:hypothetical protein